MYAVMSSNAMETKNIVENEQDQEVEQEVQMKVETITVKEWYDKYSTIDLMSATANVLKSLILYQKSVEIIGIVESLEKLTSVIKFLLINGNGDNITVLTFVGDQHKVKEVVQGCLVHIDGGYVKPRHSSYSRSTVNFDLVITCNAEVTVILDTVGSYQVVRNDPIDVSFEDCLSYNDFIRISGYMLHEINETLSYNNLKLNKGCICKGIYKLEIRMTSVVNMSEFAIGCPVYVIGRIKYSKEDIPYIDVEYKSDIQINPNEEKKEIWDLLDATETPPITSSTITNKTKKMKRD